MNKISDMLSGGPHSRVMAIVSRPDSVGLTISEKTNIIARTFRLDNDNKVKLSCFYNKEVGDYFVDKMSKLTGKDKTQLRNEKDQFWSNQKYTISGDILNDKEILLEKLNELIKKHTSYGTILVFDINNAQDLNYVLTELPYEILNSFYEVKFNLRLTALYEHFNFIEYPNQWSSNKEYNIFSIIHFANELPFASVNIDVNLNMYNILHILDMIWFFRERIDSHVNFTVSNIDLIALDENLVQYIKNNYKNFYNDYRKLWEDQDNQIKNILDSIIDILSKNQNTDMMAIYNFKKMLTLKGEQQNQYWHDYFPELKKILDFLERSKSNDLVKLQTTQKKRKNIIAKAI